MLRTGQESLSLETNDAETQTPDSNMFPEEMKKAVVGIERTVNSLEKFTDGALKDIVSLVEKTDKSKELLGKQLFSQQMMENLINDLLDLAKVANSSFTLQPEFFSLP